MQLPDVEHTRARSIERCTGCAEGERDHKTDAPIVIDSAGPDVIYPPDVIGVACTQEMLTQYPTSGCSGDQVDWFAFAVHTPPSGMWVDRVEAYMAQGDVALLMDGAGTPGAVLFQGLGRGKQPEVVDRREREPARVAAGRSSILGRLSG